MDQPIEISIDQQHKNFIQHVQDETNKRILFSGPFGSGKTYFLKKFFKKEDEYSPFFIYPVNYSVSPNEDIFELLKFDIFFELLSLGVNLPEENENFSWIFRQYGLLNKASEWIVEILKNSGKIGKSVATIGEKLVELEEIIHMKGLPQRTERDQIIQFLKESVKKKGTLYEEDNNTALIKILLGQLKTSEKKPILIIDDLDRIDPDHIFRLFNVFAAHLDKNEEDNKFGFEKIIFVCDLNNIRNLFRSKYGTQVDFNGYMAKFYNADVYNFDNSAFVAEKVGELLRNLKLTKMEDLQFFPIHRPHSTIYESILYILIALVKCKAVPLRNIIKMSQHPYSFEVYDLQPFTGLRLNNIDLVPIIILDFIKWIVGGGESLVTAIQKASQSLVYQSVLDSSDRDNKQKLGHCISILTLKKSYEAKNANPDGTYHFKDFGDLVKYQIQKAGYRGEGFEAVITGSDPLNNINYFQALLQSVKKLQEYQLLK